MKHAITFAIAWLALGAAGFAQDPASRPTDRGKEGTPQDEISRRAAQDPELAKKLRLNGLKELVGVTNAKEAAGNLNEALSACDLAIVEFNKEFDRNGGTADRKTLELYKELLKTSDGLVEKVETAEYEANVPWRDTLSDKERQIWGMSRGGKLTRTATSVTIEGVSDGNRRAMGVASLLPPRAAPWNDLIIELEFTVISGEVEMYLRYWPDKKSYLIRFGPKADYEANKRYSVTLSVKGSTVTLAKAPNATATDKIRIDTSRTGGIGFAVAPEAKVEISKLRLKVLR